MKEGESMKRFACLLMLLVILPVCAFAHDLESFNLYADVFGATELSDGKINGKYTNFVSDGCNIGFSEESGETNRIIVMGNGLPFIRYGMAAIMYFCPDSSSFAYNCGMFLSCFLLAKDGDDNIAYTKEGNLIVIQIKEKGYAMVVNR